MWHQCLSFTWLIIIDIMGERWIDGDINTTEVDQDNHLKVLRLNIRPGQCPVDTYVNIALWDRNVDQVKTYNI